MILEPNCYQGTTSQVFTLGPKHAGWVPLLSKSTNASALPSLLTWSQSPQSKILLQQGTLPYLNFHTSIFLCNVPQVYSSPQLVPQASSSSSPSHLPPDAFISFTLPYFLTPWFPNQVIAHSSSSTEPPSFQHSLPRPSSSLHHLQEETKLQAGHSSTIVFSPLPTPLRLSPPHTLMNFPFITCLSPPC